MVDKNPYENDDVEVPNFGETEEKGADPIFNMDTTGVVPETDAYTTEEEAESSSKVAIVVLIVFLVLFLVGTISGWLFGISKSNEVNTVKEEASTIEKKLNEEITSLQTQVSTLTAELEAAKAATTTTTDSGSTQPGTSTPANTYYLMEDGVSVRPSAGSTDSYADYSKLPDDIKNIVYQDGKKVTTRAAKFPVYETKEVGGKSWGKVADNAWVCLDYGTKQ